MEESMIDNRETLIRLSEIFPENFQGLSLSEDGKCLIYNGEDIDISNFNVEDFVNTNTQFASSLSVLSAEDIFKIIRLHATFLGNKFTNDDKMGKTEQEVQIIKQENPLMKNINITRRRTEVGEEEFISIVDEIGHDHIFKNDKNVDILEIYEDLKARTGSDVITPTELIREIDRKLYDIDMEKAKNLSESPETSEDFANKMKRVNDPYEDDKLHEVYGNEQNDIAVVADATNPDEHRVVTFDKNEFGDLVVQSHQQNIDGTDTMVKNGDSVQMQSFESSEDDKVETEVEVEEKKNEMKVAILIPAKEFYRLLDSAVDLTEEERKNVDLYYAYLGDLVLYEDYLLPELADVLNTFRMYVYHLEYENEGMGVNPKQQEAIDKNYEMMDKKKVSTSDKGLEEINENVKKLELMRTGSTSNDGDNTGSISTIQVIAFIVGIAIILTAVTLYIIG